MDSLVSKLNSYMVGVLVAMIYDLVVYSVIAALNGLLLSQKLGLNTADVSIHRIGTS